MRQEAGLRGPAEGELLSQKVPYESPPGSGNAIRSEPILTIA